MNGSRQVALWAAIAAFFANAIALKVGDVLSGGDWVKFGGALVASLFVGGAVYAKERLDAAKRARNGS